MLQRFCVAAVIAAGLFGFSGASKADDASRIIVSAGLHDLAFHRQQEFEGRLEYRSGYAIFGNDGGVFQAVGKSLPRARSALSTKATASFWAARLNFISVSMSAMPSPTAAVSASISRISPTPIRTTPIPA